MAKSKEATYNKEEFISECAMHYATSNDFALPKKIKDDSMLFDIVRESIIERYKDAGVKVNDRFHCEACAKVVQEPDDYCWNCGEDLSEDQKGGWEREKKKKVTVVDKTGKKKDDKKKETTKKDDKKKDAGKKDDKKKNTNLALVPPTSTKSAGPTRTDSSGSQSLQERADAVGWKLEQYTKEIRRLHGSTGLAAWQIGRRLREIEKLKKFEEGKYQTMQEYVSSELTYQWATARQFMKASASVDEKIAGKVGVFTLQLFARTPQALLPKIIKAALPKDEGGKGMSRDELEEFLKTERAKTGNKSNAGRPSGGNPLRKLIGETVTIRISEWEEGTKGLAVLRCNDKDTKTGAEVVIQSASVKITFVELE